MLDKIITFTFAGVCLTAKLLVVALIPLALLWLIYRANGIKMPFWTYAIKVGNNLLDLFNEWLESLFK